MNVIPRIFKIDSVNFLEQYLTACGVEDTHLYLNPDRWMLDNPWDYENMEQAVGLLHESIDGKIGIVVDTDCDGHCAAAIITLFLKQNNINNIIHYFHAGKEHGIKDLVEQINQDSLNILIIPDANPDTESCSQINCPILVLDHHNITEDNPYPVFVNSTLSNLVNSNLSGAGVTYQFCRAYAQKYYLLCNDFSDLVATSIASDMCDLRAYENRYFVKKGLTNTINNPMLQAMYEKYAKGKDLTPETIAWYIAPKVNALCRYSDMESKQIFFRALIGEEEVQEGLKVATKAHTYQSKRTKEIVQNIEVDNKHKVIVCFGNVEDSSYLGLVANKFVGEYHKPCIILREKDEDTWSGSMRSPIPLMDIINKTGLGVCAGHDEAAGIEIKKENLDKLIEQLDLLDLDYNPPIPVSAIISPTDVTLSLCHDCYDNRLIFGKNVEKPTFYIKTNIHGENVDVYQKKNNTIAFDIDNVRYVKFRASNKEVEAFKQDYYQLEMIVTLDVNTWNDIESCQGIIQEYEIIPLEVSVEDWEDCF